MPIRPVLHFERPAVFLVSGLGDQLMSLPAVRALATIFPGGLQLLLGEGMYSFFYRGLAVSEPPVRVWWDDYEEMRIDVNRILPTARRCDLFLSLCTWATPSVLELARRMGALWSVGYFEMFDETVPDDEAANWFDLHFMVPACFRTDIHFDEFSFPPRFSPAAELAAKRFVRERVARGGRILFVHPESRPEKIWTPASFSWVIRRFLDAHPEFTAFISSVKPYPLDLGPHSHRTVYVGDHVGDHFELALAIMSQTDLFLGIDSCFLHAADLLQLPGVALFGPSKAHRWGFRLSPKTRLISGDGSMERIRRSDVLEALLEIATVACGRAGRDKNAFQRAKRRQLHGSLSIASPPTVRFETRSGSAAVMFWRPCLKLRLSLAAGPVGIIMPSNSETPAASWKLKYCQSTDCQV